MKVFLSANYIDGTPYFGHLQLVFGENLVSAQEIEVQAPTGYWAMSALFTPIGIGPYFGYIFWKLGVSKP